jgi:hypothetical protein
MRWIYQSDHAEAIDFLQSIAEREGWDFSKVSWFRIDRGRSDTCQSGAWGRCYYPTKKIPKFRISCHVRGSGSNPKVVKPFRIQVKHQPIYRNEDGSWPPIPINRWVISEREAGGQAWQSTYSRVLVHDDQEAAVWIGGHELFHFLRKTKQIPGRNIEWQADQFGLKMLNEFREGRKS